MKRFVLLLSVLFSLSLSAQNPFGEKPKPAVKKAEEIYDKLEIMPQFPGGPENMQKYLEDHVSHPTVMRGICSGRKLIAGFVVEKDGSLSQVEIIKSINGCPDFDYEVLRVIKNMPKWTPGRLNGYNVRCYYKMPVYID